MTTEIKLGPYEDKKKAKFIASRLHRARAKTTGGKTYITAIVDYPKAEDKSDFIEDERDEAAELAKQYDADKKVKDKKKKKESIEESAHDPFARFSSGTFGHQAKLNESERQLDERLAHVLNEHLPEDVPVRTSLDGHDLLVTDQHDVLFLEGSNLAVDTFQKMYSDIMEVHTETGREHGCDWLDGFEGSFKEAYDRLTVEFKRMADSTFGDWPVSRLPNERGVEAPDPGQGFINR